MLSTLLVLSSLSVGFSAVFEWGTFGAVAKGQRLERIKKSPNYRDGAFQNLSETPMKPDDVTYFKMLKDFFNKPESTVPDFELPSVKTDLKQFASEKPAIIWFGHSSYLIKINGKNILVDPVFSGHASPFSFMVNAFPGTNNYQLSDLPPIDLVLISHDHYDHLDYRTIKQFKGTNTKFCVPLGVGAHLEDWGISLNNITELDWWESYTYENQIALTAAPARHFSGRGFKRNQSLWASYVLKTPEYQLYIGGDSGYDSHFKTIGEKFGKFDLAILECGQYNYSWRFIHMMPEQTVQAAQDLNADVLFPVHNSKFALALHDWQTPLEEVTKFAAAKSQKITTPLNGQPMILGETLPAKQWWK